jgi:hypothetical protein
MRYYSYIKIMASWDMTPCNMVNLTFYTPHGVTFQNTITLIHRHNKPTSPNVSILSVSPSLIYVHSSLKFAKSFAASFTSSTDLTFHMSYLTGLRFNLVNI